MRFVGLVSRTALRKSRMPAPVSKAMRPAITIASSSAPVKANPEGARVLSATLIPGVVAAAVALGIERGSNRAGGAQEASRPLVSQQLEAPPSKPAAPQRTSYPSGRRTRSDPQHVELVVRTLRTSDLHFDSHVIALGDWSGTAEDRGQLGSGYRITRVKWFPFVRVPTFHVTGPSGGLDVHRVGAHGVRISVACWGPPS